MRSCVGGEVRLIAVFDVQRMRPSLSVLLRRVL